MSQNTVKGQKSESSEEFHNTWLFSEESFLSKCPSRKQMTLQQDLKVRELIYDFLLKLGSKLKLDGRTILAATIYINRFYMRTPITTSKYFVACAAISISCKLHDTYRPSDKIAITACMLKNPGKQIDQHSSVFWQWRDQLLYREELMLKLLNFELNVELPYDFCEELMAGKDEASENGFYSKLPDILKNAVSKVELASSLPVLVAFESRTLFGTMLVLTVFEAQSKFDTLDSLYLPKEYLETQLQVSVNECYLCYKYLMRLRSACEDPKLPSHKPFVTKIGKISKEDFYRIADGADKAVRSIVSDEETQEGEVLDLLDDI
ncbi:CIC11C00000001712 [Sungouiella intermedia]|uniref:CIC11C00000001712 n=1 Tax=Sungouiella intermedia TaxID=45354 RepID=A0A1L0GJP2_9ASCO|nr:CIC11C00000001712 [[Candida] intermedia]